MTLFLQSLVNGIIAGSIYSLFAVGLTLIYGVFNFINFAHGELIMLGAYFFYLFINPPFSFIIPFALILSLFFTSIAGLMINRFVYQPLKNSSHLTLLISTLGLSIFLRNFAQFIWGAQIRDYHFELKRGFLIGGISITTIQIVIILTSIIIIFLLYFLFSHTIIGKSMRAMSDSQVLSRIVGLNVKKITIYVWITASSLAAIGGILLGADTNLQPGMGLINLIKAFAATLLGGVGNIWGALWGGFIIGVAENLGIWVISPGYKDGIAFAIILVMLLFRAKTIFLKS